MSSYVSVFVQAAQNAFTGRKKRRASQPKNRNGLHFESLESRTLLAGDMAEITGLVLNDLQGDGNAGNDIAAPGVTVRLYRDGGDGTFNNGGGDDSPVLSPRTTDSSGRYSFAGVSAGTYFVQITPPSDQHTRPGGNVSTVVVSANDAEGAEGRKIDDFDSLQRVVATPPLPSVESSLQLDSGVLGGQRDMHVQLTEGTDPYSEVSLTSAMGLLRLASDTAVTGNAKVIWDGVDTDAINVNPVGLGSIDLSTFNGARMTGISLTVGADHANTTVKLKIYTDGENWSEYTTTVPETPGGVATSNAVFQFADQPTNMAGAGADISNVGAIELTFEGVSAVDGQVSVIGLVGLTPKQADFTVFDRLSLGDHVWEEIVNDGRNQGEPGTNGALVNLFEDTNGDGQFTAGADAFLESTVTDANGDFLFTNLFPGDFIVQIDPGNFAAGGPLFGLQSATGNGVAPDPDDDTNGDDNGEPLTGNGVVSQAVTLTARAEPTNDGDNDPNTNLSVDFGFFGFDLAIDKEIDEAAAVPGEQLHFTIVVTNTGPTTAEDVVFTDELPPEVGFVSATASNGAQVFRSISDDFEGGTSVERLSADLGDMAAGATVTINIVTDVRQNLSSDKVKNIAEVSAPNEPDTSNNMDMDMVPVTPKIDLAITKVDSDDPLEPGNEFSYTLTATNNGPSNATGVEVSDILPDGVTFVSATPVVTRTMADKFIFEVGDLAVGQSRTFTINVRVNDDFFGTLLNEAWVKGNEEETNLDNNHDDETTVVVEPVIDLAITKVDSKDPVAPGEVFSYVVHAVNNGPFDATGVVVTDELPADVSFQSASVQPNSQAGGDLVFNVGDLAVGETWDVTINVQVDHLFEGTLLNEVQIVGHQRETRTDNNFDDEPTLVLIEPATIAGTVFVDGNDNSRLDAGEQRIPDVPIQLIGMDFRGNSVNRTMVTDSQGNYRFTNVMPGQYSIAETQPATYLGRKLLDGGDELGDNGDGVDTGLDGFKAPDLNDNDEVDSDRFDGIELLAGNNGTRYNFGELVTGLSKRDHIREAIWNL